MTMPNLQLSIRLDLANGKRIGPGKIGLLEAIRAKGSITAAALHLGMSYRRAWRLVQDINDTLQQPAVTTSIGGRRGSSGAAVTPVGREVIKLYRYIENATHMSAYHERLAIAGLSRRKKRRAARKRDR
jgi:molybdate transport system regulatory protein